MNTIKVRIRVALFPDGTYLAYGDGKDKSAEGMLADLLDAYPPGESRTWVVAEIPLPPAEVAGSAEA